MASEILLIDTYSLLQNQIVFGVVVVGIIPQPALFKEEEAFGVMNRLRHQLSCNFRRIVEIPGVIN